MIVARAAFLSLAALALAACGGSDGSAPSASESAAASDILLPDDMIIGAADAPVTIIEYASVTCPHCATFHSRVYPTIKSEYVDTGKVRFVFREFPTAPANLAMAGFVMARCVAERAGEEREGEAYFGVVGALFASQSSWLYGENADPRGEFLKVAGEAGLSEAELETCLSNQETVETIGAIIEDGRTTYDITGTPSFVVDGQLVKNLRTEEDFKKTIEERLAAAS
ncbi:MAG: DsbA family protein [Pseudomonadota bacterium]